MKDDTLTTYMENITPKKASFMLENYKYEGQRGVSDGWVNFLASEMEKGNFSETAIIAIGCLGKEVYLINGQHTLNAILESGKAFNLPIVNHRVKNSDELSKLYAHYDIGRKRTFADSVKAYGVSEKTGLSRFEVNNLASAIRNIRNGFVRQPGNRSISNEELIAVLYDWVDEYKAYAEVTLGGGGGIRDRLLTKSFCSVGITLMRHQPVLAREFFYQVIRDDGLRAGDPRKAFNAKLITITAIIKISGTNKVLLLKDELQSKIMAHCWNKFYAGSDLIYIKETLIDKWPDLEIAGTPYKIG